MSDESGKPKYKVIGHAMSGAYHYCDVPNKTTTKLGTVSECAACGTWWVLARGGYAGSKWEVADFWVRRAVKKQLRRERKKS